MRKILISIGTNALINEFRARLSLLTLDEGGNVLAEQYHSYSFIPGEDLRVARARLDAHLGSDQGGIPGAPWPPIPDAEWGKVTSSRPIFHTAEVVSAYQAEQAALAEAEAQRQAELAAREAARQQAAQAEFEAAQAAEQERIASLVAAELARQQAQP